MKLLLLTAAASAIATSAFATGTTTPAPPPVTTPVSITTPSTAITDAASQVQHQQQQQQDQSAANHAQQSVDARQYTRRGVAPAYAPTVINMAPCAMGAGFGVQGSSFGISLGGSKTNQACERRANALLLMELGEREAAVIYLAGSDRAMSDALRQARLQPAPAVIVPAPALSPAAPPPPMYTPAAHSSTDGERG